MRMGPLPASIRLLPLVLSALLAPSALAGGSSEAALLLVDPSSKEALYVANYYANARQVPASNLVFMEPGAANYPAFVDANQEAFFGTLGGRRIEHADYVVVMPGAGFYVSAPGLVSDGCSPVNRFSIAAPYMLANQSATILGGVPVSRANRYSSTSNTAVAFDSSIAWLNGQPSTSPNAERYYIAAMLGYTGLRGNTLAEILDLIDRSVAVDGTMPASTFYFMQTTDLARSAPRHGAYPIVSSAIVMAGGMAQHLMANLPLGQFDCQGIMTGLANPDIQNAGYAILPGAFCDHLTSYAGMFDNGSQTKMSEWITKGASGSSGTVEEPCNYAGKFPHARMHLYYFQGLPMADAWMRSMGYNPFQNLLYGDPLTRPYARTPGIDVPDAPAGPVSGSVLLTPTAMTHPAQTVSDLELYVDGVLVRRGTLGQSIPLQTGHLDDGWHELRVLGYDDKPARHVGRWISAVVVDNAGGSATLGASATSGDLDTLFDFTLEAPGQTASELRLVSAGRVLAATSANPGVVTVSGMNLGAGPVSVQAEALLANGMRVRSAPKLLDIAFVDTQVGGAVPTAYSYEKRVPADQTTVVELPALFEDDPLNVSFAITGPPAQATLLGNSIRGYRIVQPNPGATGTDTITFVVDSPSGVSAAGIVTIVYENNDCPQPTSYCVAAPNSAGAGALLSVDGSPSVLANELELSVTGASSSQPGLFYYGPEQIQVPFGDGFRCVGAGGVGTFRLAVVSSDVFGDASLPLDLDAPPALAGPGEIAPGDTWNFQFWYRDPAAGMNGFNLSDAVAVGFCP